MNHPHLHSRHRQRWHVVAALMLLAALTIFAPDAHAQRGGGPTNVHVQPVQSIEITEQRMVTGDLRSARRSDVAAREPGIVLTLLVEEGQEITGGTVIAELDASRLELEILEKAADHEVAKAILAQREETVARRTRDVEIVRASYERGAADQRELLDAESDLRIAQAEVKEASQRIDVIAAERALLDRRRSDLTIVAPFSGVVIERQVELGEWVAEGAPVITLQSTDSIEAWINVPQRFLSLFATEDPRVSVALDPESDLLPVTRQRIVPRVDARSRTFALIADIDDPEHALAPGMSVVTWIPTGVRAERLVVPSDAVLRNETGSFVYVVRTTNPEEPPSAMPANIRVLFPTAEGYVIAPGPVAAGDLVVTEGNERLFPMTPVNPIQKDSSDGADS